MTMTLMSGMCRATFCLTEEPHFSTSQLFAARLLWGCGCATTMTEFTRSRIVLIASLVVAAVPFFLRKDQLQASFSRGLVYKPTMFEVHRRMESSTSYRRPVMHTYFSSLPADSHNKSASMTITAHDKMIKVWEDSWRDAGWHTRILTIDDAKLHPEFSVIDSYVKNFTTDEYNKACYYRWLAMAAVGGGWMSDYDTIPLHSFTEQGFNLPAKGALVVYEGPHVPSLLSGSSGEWLRMTKRLVEFASVHRDANGNTVSDMISLSELIQKHRNIYLYQKEVAGSNKIRVDGNWTNAICEEAVPRHWRAAHFSHDFVEWFWMKKHPNYTIDDRPLIEKLWLDQWLENCGRHQWQGMLDS